MDGPSIQELRKEASALGVSGGGSKDDLAARIAAARALAPDIDVREGDSVTIETLGDEPAEVREALKDVPEPPRSTTESVWLGSHFVDIGSCAYKELIAMGLAPSEGPPDA